MKYYFLIFSYLTYALIGLCQAEVIVQTKELKINHVADSDAYAVTKDGEKRATIIIQTYDDIQLFERYIKNLGHTLSSSELDKIKKNLDSTLREPTPAERVEVALYNMERAAEISVQENNKAVCSDHSQADNVSTTSDPLPPRQWFCACANPEEKEEDQVTFAVVQSAHEENLLESWLGNNLNQVVTFDTFNDNPLHGGASYFVDGKTADDVGRTFGASLDYGAYGDEGDLEIGLEKNLFSKRISHTLHNGKISRLDEKGNKFGEATEETELTLFTRKKYKGIYLAGELELTEESNENRGLQSVQNYWHRMQNSAEYNYLNNGESDYSAKVKGGVSYKLDKDIGHWRCRMVNDALIGTDMLNPKDVELSLRTQIDINSGTLGGQEKNNPWIGVSALANHDFSADGIDSHYGAKVYTSFKVHDTLIQPFYGIHLYDQQLDRRYANEDGKPELIHSVGLTFNF